MWYVIQTITGKERELVEAIWQVIARERKAYDRCFVICQECMRRRNGILEYYVETLFPSYVFVETNMPEEFFRELKQVPKVSRFLGVDGCFWNIYEEEKIFLLRMIEESQRALGVVKNATTKQDREYVIRPSLVWTDVKGQIIKAEGIVGCYLDKIVKQRLRKRSVIIEIPFCGKMRRIRLGIRLEGDLDEGRDEDIR